MCESDLAPRHFVKNYIKTHNFVNEISIFVIEKRREAPKILLETPNFCYEIGVFIIYIKMREAPKIFRIVFIS